MKCHRFATLVLVIFALLSLPTFAAAASWQEAISAVRSNAALLDERADALGYPPLGTAYNEVDAIEHECAILGRMLGKAELIRHLEKEAPPETADGQELRIAAQSLENWIVAAENALALSKQQRVQVWNLDCPGHMGIAGTGYILATPGPRAFYDVTEDGSTLRVLGDVELGFADKIRSALDDNPGVTVIALGSAGGIVLEAIDAGSEIRARKLETTLWNNCYSACPLVFLGGTSRTIWSPYPELGFHQMSRDGLAVQLDDPLYALVREYADAMGANSDIVMSFMLSAPPHAMRVPDLFDLCDAKIALWVQRACSADE